MNLDTFHDFRQLSEMNVFVDHHVSYQKEPGEPTRASVQQCRRAWHGPRSGVRWVGTRVVGSGDRRRGTVPPPWLPSGLLMTTLCHYWAYTVPTLGLHRAYTGPTLATQSDTVPDSQTRCRTVRHSAEQEIDRFSLKFMKIMNLIDFL